MTPIRTILSIALTPNKIIKPIPAEIPNTVPVTHKEIKPPIKAYGIVLTAISVSLKLPKLKYNKNRISTNTTGTIKASCVVARSLLSNSPAHFITFSLGNFTSFATFFCASAMVLSKSRPAILKPMAMYLLFPSR